MGINGQIWKPETALNVNDPKRENVALGLGAWNVQAFKIQVCHEFEIAGFKVRTYFSRQKGGSSIGRVAVSKTVGWGFKSLPPCQIPPSGIGEVAEWSIAAVLKTVEGHTSGGSNPSFSASE